MRKVILLLLSFSMLIISISPCFLVMAKDIEKYQYNKASAELQNFAKEVLSFTSKYDSDLNDSHNSSNTSETVSFSTMSSGESEVNYEIFETKRLIVYSDEIFDTYNAVEHISGYKDWHLLQYDSIEATFEAYEYYCDNKKIDSVKPDFIVTLQGFEETLETESSNDFDYPHDTTLKSSWGYEQIRTFDAFKYILQHKELKELPEIVVGIVDDGVWTGNKYFDERLIGAYSFVNYDPYKSVDGHGALVAGVILENTLPNVKIISYQAFGPKVNGVTTVIRTDLAEEQARLDGVDIINSSYGSIDIGNATSNANNTSIKNDTPLQIAAAGNEGNRILHYPAALKNVISVAASNKNNRLASFSTYGTWVDVAAPGAEIFSAWPAYEGKSYRFDGTSCAAPFTTSVCAMIMTQYPTFSNSLVADILFKSCTNNTNVSVCHGIVNMFNAVTYYDGDARQTATPQFNLSSQPAENQFYSEKQYIELTCPDDNSEIYYTLDKTVPSRTNGILYTEPIEISTTTTISAIAYTNEYFTSEVSERTFYVRIPLADYPNENGWHIRDNGMIWGYSGPDMDLVIPETVFGIKVLGIENGAFSEQAYINSISMPKSLKTIEEKAFYKCNSLKSIVAPGVIDIGKSAFLGCRELNSVYLPEIQTIEDYAFRDSGSLNGFPFENLKKVPKFAFAESDILKVNLEKATSVRESAFQKCNSLTEVSITHVDTENMGQAVFRGCTMLKFVEFGKKAYSLPDRTFENCNFSSLDCFDTIEYIGFNAFANNQALINISMENLVYAEDGAFEDCTNLVSANLPSLIAIDSETFKGCSSLTTLILSNNVDLLEYNAFDGCENLKYILINGDLWIDSAAFEGSSVERLEMNGVSIADSLPEIENSIIALPSTFKECREDTTGRNYRIYGTKGTIAESFAIKNGHTFIEVSQETAILEDIPKEYNGNGQILSPDVIGFNRTYQWYSNTTDNNTTGKAIEGATSKTFNPADYPAAAYYYCEVTSKDEDFEEIIIRTRTCENRSIISDVTKVEYVQQEDTHKDFTVTANGRKSMIQFIEPDGGTRTYDRYHKNVSITSYNSDGEVVNELSRDLAYEVWEIYSNMSVGNEIKVRGKVNGKWDIGKYKFTIEHYNPIISMELSSTSGKLGPVPAKVVADEKTEKVMFKMPDNTTVTVASKATDENGNKIFTGKAWMNEDGLNEIEVKIYRNKVWKTVGTLEYTVE